MNFLDEKGRLKFFEAIQNIREVYSKLPIVVAGEYVDTISRYIDADGKQCVVPPGFMISYVGGENSLSTGVIAYQVPRHEISSAVKLDKEEMMWKYNSFFWYSCLLLNEKLPLCNFYEYEEAVINASISKYGGYYSSCSPVQKNKVSGRYSVVTPKDYWRNLETMSADDIIEMEKRDGYLIKEGNIFSTVCTKVTATSMLCTREDDSVYRKIELDSATFVYDKFAVRCCDMGEPGSPEFMVHLYIR